MDSSPEADSLFRSGFVSLVGRPNVGKSTLTNRLVGEKIAITSDKPQTTRNRIMGVVNLSGAQIVLMDTPGFHRPRHKLGEMMVRVAQSAMRDVEVIYFLVEATSPKPGPGDKYIAEFLQNTDIPIFMVMNKIDEVYPDRLPEVIANYQELLPVTEIIPVSAIEGTNLDTLLAKTITLLPEGPQYFPENVVTDQAEHFLITELVREQVLNLTRDEVPHSVAVVVDEFEERDNGMLYVRAIIYVERESQKGIIVGDKGFMIKEIGLQARSEIERIMGIPVYLDLWVKVKREWRNKEMLLQNFGYTLPDDK